MSVFLAQLWRCDSSSVERPLTASLSPNTMRSPVSVSDFVSAVLRKKSFSLLGKQLICSLKHDARDKPSESRSNIENKLKQRDWNFYGGVVLAKHLTNIYPQHVCVPSSMSVARLHGNDALAAVAQAIVLIHSLSVLIHRQNESENGSLRERERIIMFPLLSRLPQLSLKRSSQSTCLLIHLKLTNNRTPPPPPCLYLPLSSLVLPPSVFSLFHIKLLFIALFPNTFPPHSSSCLSVCTNLRALPLYVFRLQPRLTSQLYVDLAERTPAPPAEPPTSLLVTLLPPPCFAAGHRKRKNAETENFRLYTARGKAAV